jgi:hypothetical protein
LCVCPKLVLLSLGTKNEVEFPEVEKG